MENLVAKLLCKAVAKSVEEEEVGLHNLETTNVDVDEEFVPHSLDEAKAVVDVVDVEEEVGPVGLETAKAVVDVEKEFGPRATGVKCKLVAFSIGQNEQSLVKYYDLITEAAEFKKKKNEDDKKKKTDEDEKKKKTQVEEEGNEKKENAEEK
ncbi:hypothetical protein AXX17_AT1G30680 [Arabidopsis thaliana]|uniref:Uncharacterized protein n=1 Tax=Arabidopsis thaliana TaxID=3702 RepID=A0A178WGB6_ARATH|nr:hypothetical protein AXX17_AT1G30680 [Arabidopsis thaliana]